MPEPINVSFNQPFQRAVEEMKKRGVILPEKYYGELQGLHRQLNFSIAGKASLDQLQGAFDSLEEAISQGKTFREWQKDIRVQDLALPKHRLDNIFRTNIQAAYNRGHWEKFIEHQKSRPFLMYDAINDSRTRPAHHAMDGVIRPVGDAFWRSHYPPNGYRCRCRCISLNDRQARERSKNGNGLNKPIDDSMTPDKGWDYHVGQDLTAGVNNAFDDAIAKMKASKFKDAVVGYRNKISAIISNDKIDNMTYIEQKTPQEAAKFLVENDIVDHADFGKITNMALINDWNKALFDTIKEFPELRVNQQFTGSMQAQIQRWRIAAIEKEQARLMKKGYSESESLAKAEGNVENVKAIGFASSWTNNSIKVNGIAFNELYERDYIYFLGMLSNTGYWAKGSENLSYVVHHETGHQLDGLLNMAKDSELLNLFRQLKKDNLLKSEVSGYAAENATKIREFIAECWAEYKSTKSPREVARIVGEKITEKYKNKFG